MTIPIIICDIYFQTSEEASLYFTLFKVVYDVDHGKFKIHYQADNRDVCKYGLSLFVNIPWIIIF